MMLIPAGGLLIKKPDGLGRQKNRKSGQCPEAKNHLTANESEQGWSFSRIV